jgi:zinc protease
LTQADAMRIAAPSPPPVLAVPRLPGSIEISRLANGLTLCLHKNPQAPVVTTALWYRVGTRDETLAHGGIAHFLEHLMFKGSARFGPGEIDRRTQALGGSNNAFTSHDATAYYFNFAADRWRQALEIEADRMAGLRLEPDEVASERQVILEEIAMYEDDPWDALEHEAFAAFFGGHPYGRPVLGTAATLEAITPEVLSRFHRDFYRPDNAVLVVSGDIGADAEAAARHAFETLGGGAAPRPLLPPPPRPAGMARVERRQGEVPRALFVLPSPAASAAEYPLVRFVVTLLAGGRASRLHRALVDEGQLAIAVSADLPDSQLPGALVIGMELLPGVEPQRAEAALRAELERLRREPPTGEEIERARQIAVADWIFGHERVHQQALAAGFAVALFDLEHPERELRRIIEASIEEVAPVAQRVLDLDSSSVVAWSLPAE